MREDVGSGFDLKAMLNMRRIAIVQRRLTHYRVPLFIALREALAERDIHLEVLVGRGTALEEVKRDSGFLSWAKEIPTHYWLGGRVCWQPIGLYLHDTDLLVVTQENKLIQNQLLMLMPRKFKLAFWGHGANLQCENPDEIRERYKRWTTKQVDWWFAYTEMSANLVKVAGFPSNRITVLNNAVDATEMQRQRNTVVPEELKSRAKSLGFVSDRVGVFVGSLYSDKRLDFLLKAAEKVREKVPDFHLLLIGDGPERNEVVSWCETHPWARWVGAQFEREKVAHISLARFMLCPGAVGLGVMDAFVCQTPMITTDCGNHGPEISYLQNGINGVMTKNDLSAYVDAIVSLLQDEKALESLKIGCMVSAKQYTVENMAQRFARGLEECLDSPRFKVGLS